MSKAKAKQRAKAKALDKARKKIAAKNDAAGQDIPPGRFDPKTQSISSPGANTSNKTFGATKRGSARSR